MSCRRVDVRRVHRVHRRETKRRVRNYTDISVLPAPSVCLPDDFSHQTPRSIFKYRKPGEHWQDEVTLAAN